MPELDFGLWARVPQRFLPLLSPRSLFTTGQRFPIPNHKISAFPVTSGHVTSVTRGNPTTNQKPAFSLSGPTLLLRTTCESIYPGVGRNNCDSMNIPFAFLLTYSLFLLLFCDLFIICVRFLRVFLIHYCVQLLFRFCWATSVAMPVHEIRDKYRDRLQSLKWL